VEKSEKQICKVYCNNGACGTGFFCNILDGWNLFKVLITNNHVLNQNDIIIGKKIKFSINNEKTFYEIEIDESRRVYTSKKYDITIIELKQKDKLDKIDYMDIDKDIFEENYNEKYRNTQIYLLHYPKGKQMECSVGLIKDINGYIIRHLCDSSGGSSGGPIINSYDYKIIGIHIGGAAETAENYNFGTFLKEPLEKYKEQKGNKEREENENKERKEREEREKDNERERNKNKEREEDNERERNDEREKNENKKKEQNNKKENIKENDKKEKILNNENNEKKNEEDIDEIIIQYKIEDIKDYSNEIKIF
jgi:hypothetical protein